MTGSISYAFARSVAPRIVTFLSGLQAAMLARRSAVVFFLSCLLAAGCASVSGAPPGGSAPPKTGGSQQPAPHPLDAQQAERIRRVMTPLVAAMDHPRPLSQVKVGVMDDPHVNAASAGGGEFYVTSGLLQKASDDQLRGVLAHELAHDDLGHVAKAQALGVGLGVGMIILDQVLPGSSRITPIAGALVTSGYSRSEEYAADRHGTEILTRAGYPKSVMIDTLTWLVQTEGASSGGILASHPGTQDRIDALKKL